MRTRNVNLLGNVKQHVVRRDSVLMRSRRRQVACQDLSMIQLSIVDPAQSCPA